ncbi:hypothetical protein [Stutzerimonas stutzeri]|uniref:hypothetical protein n=1 Tax=Stutzerimonas stutzeri TaxID=316 RepID=UPI001F25B4C5|nr:hypothetical protein [Stutzerimonas stutzeri]
MKNINSAYRVRSVLKQAQAASEAKAVVDVWADILGPKSLEPNKKQFAVSRFLSDLHDEVELIKELMDETGFTDSLYTGTLTRCNNALAVQHLNSQWVNVKKQITSEMLVVLGFCSEILPSEETEIDQNQLQELASVVQELRDLLADSGLGITSRRVIEKHVAKIEEALGKYKAVGARGLQDALQSVIGEAVMNETELKAMKDTEEAGKFIELIRKLKDVVVSASSANQHVDSLVGMAEKADRAIGLLQRFI